MNRWNYAKSVPEKLYVACSGGVDSVAAAAILSEWRDVTLCHFGHADHASREERKVVELLARELNVPLILKDSDKEAPQCNKEHAWRNDRYEWFRSLDGHVATGHTLDDAVEWYLLTCFRGRGEFMPYAHKNVIRPFLITEKKRLIEYAMSRNLLWWEDPTNRDSEFNVRNRIRNNIIPEALKCQPGLYTTVRKRIQEKLKGAGPGTDSG